MSDTILAIDLGRFKSVACVYSRSTAAAYRPHPGSAAVPGALQTSAHPRLARTKPDRPADRRSSMIKLFQSSP